MNANYIKPIPKRIKKRILAYDEKHCTYTGVRFYAYLTTIRKELVKITVAIRNKGKKTRLIKQVAVHGVYSDKCLVRDIEYSFMGNYRVGWYDEGIKYPYNIRPFYNDGKWYPVDFKYYNPWTHTINPQFALTLPEFRYSAVDIQNPPCIITYLRTYLKYPQAEYHCPSGLHKRRTEYNRKHYRNPWETLRGNSMTKREICDSHPSFAYYSGLGGLEVKFIEYGVEHYIYLIAGQWSGKKTYHKLKIHFGKKYDYIVLHGYRCRLSDFIKL